MRCNHFSGKWGTPDESLDYNFYNPLNMTQFKDSLKSKNSIYGSNQNDAAGYTNGFYFGQIDPLCKILKRYKKFTELSVTRNYVVSMVDKGCHHVSVIL